MGDVGLYKVFVNSYIRDGHKFSNLADYLRLLKRNVILHDDHVQLCNFVESKRNDISQQAIEIINDNTLVNWLHFRMRYKY